MLEWARASEQCGADFNTQELVPKSHSKLVCGGELGFPHGVLAATGGLSTTSY